MKLLFKQRFFSWFDSYDVYDETGNVVYTVKGQLSWGHCLHVLDADGNHVGTVQERIFTLLPKFELYQGDAYLGCVQKEFTFFRPRYDIDCNGWQVAGDFMEWDYTVTTRLRQRCGRHHQGAIQLDGYLRQSMWADRADALCALMLVLAIDAEKCSRNS